MLHIGGNIIGPKISTQRHKDFRHKLKAVIGNWLGSYTILCHLVFENDAGYFDGVRFDSCSSLDYLSIVAGHHDYRLIGLFCFP